MNEKFMKLALKEAKKAYEKQEVPIGAVIVKDDIVIAKAHNLREVKNQACAHAEILAIEKACKKLDNWRLEECDMYVTLEPCAMCAGAILNARMRNVYIAAKEPRSGACGSQINLFEDYVYNHKVHYETGILEEEARTLMQSFFKERRESK
ncbi:MAG: nucleoside deaminase [Clostridia bacterium]|nr:nucleoside deaminase [Clostridia bacterium]